MLRPTFLHKNDAGSKLTFFLTFLYVCVIEVLDKCIEKLIWIAPLTQKTEWSIRKIVYCNQLKIKPKQTILVLVFLHTEEPLAHATHAEKSIEQTDINKKQKTANREHD